LYEVWRNQKSIIYAIFYCPEPDSKPKVQFVIRLHDDPVGV